MPRQANSKAAVGRYHVTDVADKFVWTLNSPCHNGLVFGAMLRNVVGVATNVWDVEDSDSPARQFDSAPGSIDQAPVGLRPQDGQRNSGKSDACTHVCSSFRETVTPSDRKCQRIADVAVPNARPLVRSNASGRNRFLSKPMRVCSKEAYLVVVNDGAGPTYDLLDLCSRLLHGSQHSFT